MNGLLMYGDDCSRWVLFLCLWITRLAFVRWIFNFIDKQEGKTIVEVIKEFKKARKDIEKQLMPPSGGFLLPKEKLNEH